MHSVTNKWCLLIDRILEDWVGVILPRPAIAMQDFVQEDGCMWCGETMEEGACFCQARRLRWNRVFRLGHYAEPLSSSILQGKYAAWYDMLAFLGRMLGKRLKGCVPPGSILVPVPMSYLRRYFRRIDHAAVIAYHASKSSGIPMHKSLFRRNTIPQATKTASQRKSLPNSAMWLRPWSRVKGKHVILVDDVLTTGKTLEIASNKLASS